MVAEATEGEDWLIRTVPQVATPGTGNGVDCETGPFPSVFKEGWLRCAINKKTPFLSGADGVVSNFQQKGALRGYL